MAAPYLVLLVFFVCSSPLLTSLSKAESELPALAEGLSYKFYKHSCPRLESIVRTQLQSIFREDITQAAGLLRVHFHDCFVQGCDGSVLLDGSTSRRPSEQEDTPNLTLRPEAFQIIEDLRDLVEEACGLAVSCADILALAARDSIYLAGGPEYKVPFGRRDSLTFATKKVTLANLPAPTSNASVLLEFFKTKKLDATDLVALSGGHTIGIGHCASFSNRLYPTQDPTMDDSFAQKLYKKCPASNTVDTTVLDIRTPDLFDNKYYVNLVNRQGLFTSDQDLYTHKKTKKIVKEFAEDELLFFEKFAISMVKMGMMDVKTGEQGEIRAKCSARNSDYISSVAEGGDKDEL